MGVSKKIYKYGLRIKEIVSRRLFFNVFIIFLIFTSFLGVFNVYAQDSWEGTYIEPAWEEQKFFHNLANRLFDKKEEDNINSRGGVGILNTAWTGVTLAIPEITGLSAAGQHLEGIPYDLRRGLIGMVDDAGTSAYAMYPSVDIPEHLAQQWVPGYKEGSVGIYAQNYDATGYGELTASGIAPIWAKTLNLSYIFFVIFMVIAGFMIMFRSKLGGQTIVTLGSVLPQVIICLVLATFSFAIAGFIIDLGGFLVGVASFILSDAGDTVPISGIGKLISVSAGGDGTFWSTIWAITKTFGAFQLFGAYKPDSFLGILKATITIIATFLPLPGSGLKVGFWGMLLILIVVGIIFTAAIRLIIVLYKAFFSLLLSVVLGPIQITLGAIPGNSKAIKNWLFSVTRNVMVFPTVFFIVNLPRAMEGNLSGDLNVRLPARLVGEDPATYGTWLADQMDSGRILVLFLKVFVLFYAAQAPKFLEAIFPPSTPQAVAEGMGAAKNQMARVPLVGRYFRDRQVKTRK